jgi:NAD(P)-dependent dehydrogenase (short-subunit alcohol dehydrogenase family)
LITGGTRGIGRGIAEAFLAEGAKVVVTGRSDEKGKQALEEMDAGDRAAFVQGDCTVQADVERMVDETVELFGSVDVLVNNAGGSWGFARVHEMEDEAWNGVLDFNLNAAFWASRRALPTMLANKWGRLIAISSVEGKEASKPTVSHYITNKHALHGLVKAIAVEYGTDGITSNAICPGAVETDLMLGPGKAFAESNDIPYEEFKKTYAEESMIKRLTTVEEVAAMAVLLASEVGGGMTGSLYNVDGGTSSW